MISRSAPRPFRIRLLERSAAERALIDCLRALDAGATVDECLAGHPRHADSIRSYLRLRSRLLADKVPAPSQEAFVSGREALLASFARPVAPLGPVRPSLSRAAAAGALLVAVLGGVLGISAADGVARARDAISALPDIPPMPTPVWPHYNSSQPLTPGGEAEAPPADAPLDTADDPAGQPPVDGTTDVVEEPQSEPVDGGLPAKDPASPETKPKDGAPHSDFWETPFRAEEPEPPDATATPEATATPTPEVTADSSPEPLPDAVVTPDAPASDDDDEDRDKDDDAALEDGDASKDGDD